MLTEIENEQPLEVALARSEARYRQLAESVSHLLWLSAVDGGVTFVNERWAQYTGLALEAIRGRSATLAFEPADARRVDALRAAALEERRSFEVEARLRRTADGRYRSFLVRCVPQLDDAGDVAAWLGTAMDIDDRVRADASLRFLADVSAQFAATRDPQRLFDGAARMSVESICDWCAVYVQDESGCLRVVSVGHADPERARSVLELARRYPPPREHPAVRAIARGQSLLVPRLDAEWLRAADDDEPQYAAMAALGIASVIVVPFDAQGERPAAIALARAADRAPFDESDLSVARILAKRVALAHENLLHYRRQQRVVDSFQRAALPKSLPRLDGLALDAVYEAASDELTVGGDWYDAFPLPDGKLVLTIGDVAGKGLDAALLMANLRQSIRVGALHGLQAAAILDGADAALQLEHPDRFATAFVAIVDPATWTIAYAGAGHPAPVVRRPDGSLLALDGKSPPLGAPSDVPRRTRSVVGIPAGSLVVLYTDGLIESTRDVIEGERRLHAALVHDAVVHAHSPAHLIRDLVLKERCDDDVAILTLALGRETHWSFESRDALAAQSARSSFVAALARDADDDGDLGAAELIFGELVGNVVRYAPGPIDIDLEWTDERAVLHVLDRGVGFDLQSSLPDDLLSERGRGLYIVSVLGEGLRADRLDPRGNHVRVTLPLRRRQV